MKLFKRILCCIICLLMTASLASCGPFVFKVTKPAAASEPTELPPGFDYDEEFDYISLDSTGYAASKHYDPIVCTASYDTLTEGQKRLYDELVKCAYKVAEKSDLYGKLFALYRCDKAVLDGVSLSETDIYIAVRAVYDDHPEIFWIEDGYCEYILEEDSCAVRIYSEFSGGDLKGWITQLQDAVKEFMDSVPKGLSAYEREKYVHDYIVDSCEYIDTDANALQFYHCVYGNMVRKKAVCEGYARTMQMLLNLLGVECVSITGDSFDDDSAASEDDEDDSLHMWNSVKLDESWYNVDATWDDDCEPYDRYMYFNVDDEIFSLDHSPSPLITTYTEEQLLSEDDDYITDSNLFVPECDDMKYNYFIKDCPHLTSYRDSKEIEDGIYNTVTSGKEYFILYVDPKFKSVEEAYDDLFEDDPQYFFDYIDNVNDRLDGTHIGDNVLCGYDEELNYIFVGLDY